jgi:hypothetical protein
MVFAGDSDQQPRIAKIYPTFKVVQNNHKWLLDAKVPILSLAEILVALLLLGGAR